MSQPNHWPQATRWHVHPCGHCPNAHITLFDEHGEPRAEFILGPDQLPTFVAECKRSFAEAIRRNVVRQNIPGGPIDEQL